MTGCVFRPMFICLKMMYSQSDETGTLETLFFLPNNGQQAFTICFLISTMGFTIWWCHFCKFLKNHKSKISKFLFPPLSGIFKISERKYNSSTYHKTLNFQRFERNKSTYSDQDRMHFLNMSDASFEF